MAMLSLLQDRKQKVFEILLTFETPSTQTDWVCVCVRMHKMYSKSKSTQCVDATSDAKSLIVGLHDTIQTNLFHSMRN